MWAHAELGALSNIECPVLLTQGGKSPARIHLIVSRSPEREIEAGGALG